MQYGGVTLDTAVPQARLIDIIIGAPVIETVLSAKTLSAGSRFARRRLGARPVKVVLDLSLPSAAERESARGALLAWCDLDAPAELVLDTIPDKHFIAVCASLPDFSVAAWWEDLSIEFTTIDPFFIDDSPHTAAVGSAFAVGGDGPAIGSIQQTIASPLTAPAWTLDAGQAIYLLGTIAAGDLDIDLERRRVDLDGTPIMGQVSMTSRFFELTPGTHTVAGSAGAAGTVTWYERWL